MMKSFQSLALVLCLLFIAGISSCKKDNDSNPTNTNPDLATLTTDRVDSITYTSAKIISTVSKEGKSAVTGMGIAWGKNPNPTVVADNKIAYPSFGVGTFGIAITGLEMGTTYYVRSYATNAVGTAYSEQKTFTTTAFVVPTLSTTAVTNVASIAALSGGSIAFNGGSPITERGIVWSTATGPTITSPGKQKDSINTGSSFNLHLSNLTPGTQYFVRAYATNSVGTGYGNEITLTTRSGLIDADGNTYTTVIIGTQTWLKENLKTTRYRNGDPIPNLTDSTQWVNTTSGAWVVLDNDPANSNVYGNLYNFYTVADTRGLCPVGYHVPGNTDWRTMEAFLGMNAYDLDHSGFNRGNGQNIGGKLKAISTLWSLPNSGATDESGFTGLPGAGFLGWYGNKGTAGQWWTSTATGPEGAWERMILWNTGGVTQFEALKKAGYSVRCVKD